MRTLISMLTEQEPCQPRFTAGLGVKSLKLTKLTLSDNTKVFMTIFESP